MTILLLFSYSFMFTPLQSFIFCFFVLIVGCNVKSCTLTLSFIFGVTGFFSMSAKRLSDSEDILLMLTLTHSKICCSCYCFAEESFTASNITFVVQNVWLVSMQGRVWKFSYRYSAKCAFFLASYSFNFYDWIKNRNIHRFLNILWRSAYFCISQIYVVLQIEIYAIFVAAFFAFSQFTFCTSSVEIFGILPLWLQTANGSDKAASSKVDMSSRTPEHRE